MFNDSGYINSDERGTIDYVNRLSINSAGHYKLITQPCAETTRPSGRIDFQLLYIAKGSAYFQINHKLHKVGEGNFVLYWPRDCQYYRYEHIDQPDVYWVHFTGYGCETHLSQLDFNQSGIYFVGPHREFVLLFQKIIQELQVKKNRFHTLCNLYLMELIELMARYTVENSRNIWEHHEIVEKAIVDFHQTYHLPIQINAYSKNLNISTCWFIRCFKRYTGKTPAQYISEIRMDKAKELLYSSTFTCNEIAQNVGYTDPLYFSRYFKQTVGISPQAYRKKIRSKHVEIETIPKP